MIIKPCTRTIYIKLPNYYSCEELGLQHVNDERNLVRFRLNLPQYELLSVICSRTCEPAYAFVPFDGVNYYYSPLLSTYCRGTICLGEHCYSEEEAIEKVFSTSFNFDIRSSIGMYCETNVPDILKFYKNWEESGKIELIPCRKPGT